jgi:hypothetical protein
LIGAFMRIARYRSRAQACLVAKFQKTVIQPALQALDLNPIVTFLTGMHGRREKSLTGYTAQHCPRDECDRSQHPCQERCHHKHGVIVRKGGVDSDDQGQQHIQPSSAGNPKFARTMPA